jgi:putative membrane protein
MVQHQVLMLGAAPLIVLGWPPPRWLRGLGSPGRRLLRWRPTRGAWRAGTSVLGAWVLQALTLWAWHAPAFFDAALETPPLHALEHASFLLTAVLFWGSLLHPGAAGYGAAVASTFTTALHTGALGALLTFGPTPRYAAYGGPGALEDQQLAGLIMWIPSGAILVAAGVGLAAAWLRQAARQGARRDVRAMSRER